MNKLIIVLAICGLFGLPALAQVKQKIYYDAQMSVTKNEQKARFVEEIERENEKAKAGIIKLYKLPENPSSSLVLLKEGTYESIKEPRKLNGQLITYYEDGTKESTGSFKSGIKEGNCTQWYKSGQLYYTINFKNGLYNGELKSYYENGKPKRDDIYEEGKLVQGKCYNEVGEEVIYSPFAQKASFPGGDIQMLKYVATEVRYPAEALRAGKSGLVVVQANVDEEGNLSDFSFAKTVYPALNSEAMRVVKSMPKWVPATIEGKAEKSVAYIPVKFTIR